MQEVFSIHIGCGVLKNQAVTILVKLTNRLSGGLKPGGKVPPYAKA